MAKRIIYRTELMEDIRSGMGDVPIMEKYQISPREFMEILEKLGGLTPTDSKHVDARIREMEKKSDPSEMRSIPRNYMVFRATVEDADDPSVSGSVNDITESGIQVEGIRAYVEETRSFVIRSDFLAEVPGVAFEATCKWTKRGDINENDTAGFEITSITESNLAELRKLIQHLSLGEQ